jgi:cell wall-associated NlpC family hydrolase
MIAPRADLSDLIGRPFRFGGRGPLEYDCYGLCIEIYRRIGRTLPDFGSAVLPSVIDSMIDRNSSAFIRVDHPSPWSLVTFTIRQPWTSHIGVILGDGMRFIHVSQKVCVCIERLDSLLWKNRITGYFEYVGRTA